MMLTLTEVLKGSVICEEKKERKQRKMFSNKVQVHEMLKTLQSSLVCNG